MKKKILGICIIVLMLVALVSGCTENKTTDDGDNGGGTTGNTYTWTAEEFEDDLTFDTDWETYFKMVFGTLADGDTLILQDTISEISYDSLTDRTTITFDTSEGGDISSSINNNFEGDITDTYQVGDEVKITVTIKHVEFTDDSTGTSMDYELEIFEEQWTTQEEYVTSGGGALPSSTIEKIE